MEKGKVKEEINPFKQFSVLKGQFVEPDETNIVDSDITTDTNTIVPENDGLKEDAIEAEKLAKGDKALEKVIEKTISKKKATEVIKEEEIEDLEETEEETEDPDKPSFKGFVKALYNNGIVDVDDTDEDFEDTEAGVGKVINKTVDKRINKWVESKNPDFIKFMEFTDNGGNPKDFLDIYYGRHSWEGFSVETEANQKAVISESLRLSEYTEEDINDMITEWTDNGTLEKRAKSALPIVQKHENKQKIAIVEMAKAEKLKEQKANEAYWNSFKEGLYKKEEIKGFKLTPKVKDNLWDFMTTVDRKTGKTPYQEATESDGDSSLLFAYLAMNKFDISKLETQVKTKVSKEFNKMLQNYSKTTKEKISSGITEEHQDESPFSAFRTIK